MPRTIKPLTALQINQAKPKDKIYGLNDGDGLQLRITKSGSKTWYLNYYRPSDNKRTMLKLGLYPELPLVEARERRAECRKLLSDNIDPALVKQNKLLEGKNTLEAITTAWLKIKQTQITEDYATDIINSLENHIFPKLGKTPVTQITAPIVIEVIKPISQKGSHETVKRLCQRLNEIMQYSVNIGAILHNPLTGIRDAFIAPKKKHLPTLKPDELPELIKTIYNASIRNRTRDLILFQLHTMTRPAEASGAQWSEIDLDAGLWTIPPERMKRKREHKIPLTPQVIAILEGLNSGYTDFVFIGDRSLKKPINSQTANMAIRRMGYGGRLVAHGLRSLASTTLNEQGFDAELIEVSLSHVDKNTVREAYNRSEYIERRRKMMEWWSNHINEAMTTGFNQNVSKAGLSVVSG